MRNTDWGTHGILELEGTLKTTSSPTAYSFDILLKWRKGDLMKDMYRIMRYSDLNWAREQEGRNVYFYCIYSLVWHFVEEEMVRMTSLTH